MGWIRPLTVSVKGLRLLQGWSVFPGQVEAPSTMPAGEDSLTTPSKVFDQLVHLICWSIHSEQYCTLIIRMWISVMPRSEFISACVYLPPFVCSVFSPIARKGRSRKRTLLPEHAADRWWGPRCAFTRAQREAIRCVWTQVAEVKWVHEITFWDRLYTDLYVGYTNIVYFINYMYCICNF